jgi:hypothetical protein
MRSQVLATGIADEREPDEVDRAVREHLDDPGTLVMPGLLFLAWGRKQASAIALSNNLTTRRVAPCPADTYP